MSSVPLSDRPVPITRRDRALAELVAELIGEAVATRLRPSAPEPEPEAPGGPYQQLIYGPPGTGTAPAVYTVTATAIFPLSVFCRLTCSAVVADRSVALEYRSGDGARFLVAGSQAVVQANGQQAFVWHPEAGGVAWPIEDAAIAGLPQQWLMYGQQLALRVWNGDAGDALDQVRISAQLVNDLRLMNPEGQAATTRR